MIFPSLRSSGGPGILCRVSSRLLRCRLRDGFLKLCWMGLCPEETPVETTVGSVIFAIALGLLLAEYDMVPDKLDCASTTVYYILMTAGTILFTNLAFRLIWLPICDPLAMDFLSVMAVTVVADQQGNLRITVKKTKPLLGIAIEGGANTRHPLPRIINIHENGAAFDAGGLEVGQLILEVDGHKVEGMQHQEVARLIAESFARREKHEIEFLVVEAKKSNLEPKPTALIFLEA